MMIALAFAFRIRDLDSPTPPVRDFPRRPCIRAAQERNTGTMLRIGNEGNEAIALTWRLHTRSLDSASQPVRYFPAESRLRAACEEG